MYVVQQLEEFGGKMQRTRLEELKNGLQASPNLMSEFLSDKVQKVIVSDKHRRLTMRCGNVDVLWSSSCGC